MTITTARRTAARAVTRLAVRHARRTALIVLVVAVGMSTVVAATYARTVGGDADALAALARNPAIRTLFGEPVALDTVGGFTVWRTGTVLAVLLTVYGVLLTTRVTRGEEEAHRWDLLLAGPLAPAAVLRRHLAVVIAVMALTGTGIAVALIVVGTPSAGAVLHTAGLALAGTFAVAVAALAAQVFPTRAGATGASLAVLGVALLARMVGDGVTILAWLRWLPPYGPLALARPYQANRWPPVIVVALATILVAYAALILASRRDVREGLLPASAGRRIRGRLLGSIVAFAARRALRPLAGWSAGIAAYFLLIGLLAISLTDFLIDNPRFADLAAQAGFGGLGTARGYAATLFALLTVPLGGFAAVRLAAFATEEAAGRLTLLLAQPITRSHLYVAEAAVTLAGTIVLAAVAGAASWLGATFVGADLPLPAALAGTANVLPVALLSLTAAMLAVGVTPRAVTAVGMTPTAGGFLLTALADSVHAPHWLVWASPYTHLAAVPSTGPNWPATTAMLAAASVAGAIGGWRYRRRDLLT